MKKVISLVLVTIFVLSIGAVAFARYENATINPNLNSRPAVFNGSGRWKADTDVNTAIDSKVYINEWLKYDNAKPVVTAESTTINTASTKAVENYFEKYFTNKVVALDGGEDAEATAEKGMKLIDFDAKEMTTYIYNATTNKYYTLKEAADMIYMGAGDVTYVIISDGPLVRK